MKKLFILLLLAVGSLACTVYTAGSLAAQAEQQPSSLVTLQVMTQSVITTASCSDTVSIPYQAAQANQERCTVDTGIVTGSLTVRACGSVDCTAVGWLTDGDTITPTHQANSSGWLPITGSLAGWVNSRYVNCDGDTK